MQVSPEVARILREVFAATADRYATSTGVDTRGWVKAAGTCLKQKHKAAAKVVEALGYEALIQRELDGWIRSSRVPEIADAAALDQNARLQRKLLQFIVFRNDEGQPVRKRLRETSMEELSKVIKYYRAQSAAMNRRADRYEAIHQQMVLRGFQPSDLVGCLVA